MLLKMEHAVGQTGCPHCAHFIRPVVQIVQESGKMLCHIWSTDVQ